jgi:hypothetical protein
MAQTRLQNTVQDFDASPQIQHWAIFLSDHTRRREWKAHEVIRTITGSSSVQR